MGSLAEGLAAEGPSWGPGQSPGKKGKETRVKSGKKGDKKRETLRPWLVDVSLDHLR